MLPQVPNTDPQQMDIPDVAHLLRIMGELAALRNDPRRWRLAMLGEINRLLPAAVSAAFVLKDLALGIPPLAVSIFEAGFRNELQRESFLQEFNEAPFNDPLSRACFDRFLTSGARSLTLLRRDVVSDERWHKSPHVQQYRRPADIDDCVFSIFQGVDRTQALVLCAFRRWEAVPPFAPREKALLHTLHTGLEWMYRTEETNNRLSRATELSPRLRETLDHLLRGQTERQVARHMSLSVHTVHDYVKMLYTHFGVSSRSELLARWLQTGGTLPDRETNAE